MGNTNNDATTRIIRKQQGLSLDELGRRTGIERTRLCRFELGYLDLRRDELARLAKALRVRVSRLQGRANERAR